MDAWLIDAYRTEECIILWVKAEHGDIRIEKRWKPCVYLEDSEGSRLFIKKYGLESILEIKPMYTGDNKRVLAIPIPQVGSFERFVRWIERETKHRIPLYNADVLPEQSFLMRYDLMPFSPIRAMKNTIIAIEASVNSHNIPNLKRVDLEIVSSKGIIDSIDIDGRVLKGAEQDILKSFVEVFHKIDPDVIMMDRAFVNVPLLMDRLLHYGIDCRMHRWDPMHLRSRGGRSFHSYGQVRYREVAVRLHGRILIDSSSEVSEESGIEGLIELCRLTGNLPQQAASRSFGASFQHAIVRRMMRQGLLIPFKEKPLDPPISLLEMVKSDRAGHTLDPLVGFHTDVAELDFCSMYPWIMYNHNISADTIIRKEHPLKIVPGLKMSISENVRGIVPQAIKPILDARMRYKASADLIDKQKAKALKWVLVTSYGYLRFREFKLGIGESHMAVGAYARETLITAKTIAEESGFDVIHGIIDSLYVKKSRPQGAINDSEITKLCEQLHMRTGIPVSFEGVFKWVVFLPSVNDPDRPVPAKYFGVFKDGTIKARGIEVRERNSPQVVKDVQKRVLELMAVCDTKEEIQSRIPKIMRLYRDALRKLSRMPKESLICSIRIGRSEYTNDIPQKEILRIYKKRGIEVHPGQMVRFIMCGSRSKKVVLPQDYQGNPDLAYYRRLIARSIYIILAPFGLKKRDLDAASGERQTKIADFNTSIHNRANSKNIRHHTEVAPSLQVLYNTTPTQCSPTSMEG